MRRGGLDRLRPLEVILILGPLFLFALGGTGGDIPLLEEELADPGPRVLVLAYHLGDDVTGAGQRLLDRGHSLLLVDIPGRLGRDVQRRILVLGQDRQRQRLQALFLGDGGAGAPFGTEGKIDVFQHRHGLGSHDLFVELIGQKPPLDEGGKDRGLSLVQLKELFETIPDGGDGDLVQRTGRLFPIPGDKGNRAPLGKEVGRRPDLPRLEGELPGNQRHMFLAELFIRYRDDVRRRLYLIFH